MAMGRSRSSLSRLAWSRKRRGEDRKAKALRKLQLEALEERRLLATGPQLVGVQPNSGDLLKEGDVLTVSPQELTFQFSEGQSIDPATLGAIQVWRSGGDGTFSVASARTDFNTKGAVTVEFQALDPGTSGDGIQLQFSKANRGGSGVPRISVDGKTIFVELNNSATGKTTAKSLVTALNSDAIAGKLLHAVVLYGSTATDITTPAVTYSPVILGGANAATASASFNTGKNLEIRFTAVSSGVDGNGLQVSFTKRDMGGARDPIITVSDARTITVELNSHSGTQTTAAQLVSAFQANAAASAVVSVTLASGDPATDIATPTINYSPLTLTGANDVVLTPGHLGVADDDPRKVIFRFAETLPDDRYRIDVQGTGTASLRNVAGLALGDTTDDSVDNGANFSRRFELDLAPQVLAVVPQPISRSASGALSQSTSQIEVYFNDDDLDPVTATNPSFYQLLFTNDTVQNTDDRRYLPIAVQYFPESDRAMLTFAAPLHLLGSGAGTFRLRIGTDEAVPAAPIAVDLSRTDAGSSYGEAYALGTLTGSTVIAAGIDPQLYELEFPGAGDEPGHRDVSELAVYGEEHLLEAADQISGIQTVYYNFRDDYGADPAGNVLRNSISLEQKQRAREAFETYANYLGVQFVETATQGITVATGDLRAVDVNAQTGAGGTYGLAGTSLRNDQPTVVLDNAENWYDAYGRSDDGRASWFEVALKQIGTSLGLGYASDLPAGTVMQGELMDATAEAVYPGDADIVHGQYLYRPEGKDIDLYQFAITTSGYFTAETVAERQSDSSLLDSALALYREVNGERELVARNDDYCGNDSLLKLDLEPGTYYVGVSASGNTDYDPNLEDSGLGGRSEGKYDLRLTFRPTANNSIHDLDNVGHTNLDAVAQATALDGDGDGIPGGVYNFWFRVDATPLIVDKAAKTNGTGSLTAPFNKISSALAAALPGDVVRIVGNGGTDGNLATPADATPYLIGYDQLNRALTDGSTLDVPRGVTVMIDRGAVLKLRSARIGVGSSTATVDRSAGALQVLGTPRLIDAAGNVVDDASGNPLTGNVSFTALNDDSLGGDTNPTVADRPQPGDWGGLVFRRDLDSAAGRFNYEKRGVFLDYVNQADMRYGGGTVREGTGTQAVSQQYAPVFVSDARPTVTNNTIRFSAQAAISANPDSFEETDFLAPEYQTVSFTPDYTRVGLEVHGNRVTDNSINGLFVRLTTPASGELEQLTVSGRWDDADMVYVLSQTLRIQGSAGGPVQTLTPPQANLITLQTQAASPGSIPAGIVNYKLTYVDAAGNESPASDATVDTLVDVVDQDTGATESVLLGNLPTAAAGYTGRRLYRSEKGEYVLVAALDATIRTYLDTGAVVGGLLQPSAFQLNARLHGQLVIDPGVIVKLNGASIETGFGSQLLAEGRPGREVVFTSLGDVRYGAGGTFATGSRGAAQPGSWGGIYAGPVSRLSIDHAVVAYGGGVVAIPGTSAGFNPIEIQQAEARIANSVFERNANGTGGQATANRVGRGANASATIFVRGAQPVIVNNILRSNVGPAVSVNVNALNAELVTDPGRATGENDRFSAFVANQGPLVRENRMVGNSINGMQIRGGTLTTEGVWDDTDIVHVLQNETVSVPDFHTYGGLRLQSSGSESLVVKVLGTGAGFSVGGQLLDNTDRIGGAIQVLGQPEHPVVLTSLNDDSVGAGYQPDGSLLTDTNNNGSGDVDGGTLPTVPDVPNGVRIDDNVAVDVVGHFEYEPVAGGGASWSSWTVPSVPSPYGPYGPDGVTAQGNTQPFVNNSFIFEYSNYVDVGANGGAVDLAATTITQFPTLTAPDEVVSQGTFAGANGLISWKVRTYFDSGVATLRNELTFSSAQPFGTVRFVNYLDEDVLFISDDLLYLRGTPGQPDFEAFTLDNAERIGFSQGGAYVAGSDLVNATYDGWAADQFPQLRTAITGAGTAYTIPGNIDVVDLPSITDPDLGQVYGLEDVTTAFAWSLDPTATTATIRTFLNLVPENPLPNYSGDWQGLRLTETSSDRNAAAVVERETGTAMITGTNDVPRDAQYLGVLATDEKAGDDVSRLGFVIQGALNRRSDLDVYSFEGVAGTEVWLDVDRTTMALDSVVELIDSDGLVLARSNNSGDESADPSLLYRDPTVMLAEDVQPLAKSPAIAQDYWTTNPRDAGLRVRLPGPAGSINTYHVRVRSSSASLSNLSGGRSLGMYQLQVRLREVDEQAGSTVQMADIRYATNGIELVGLPASSPLTGEAAETEDNNTRATADELGNLLQTDAGTLSVAGQLASATDWDWYRFEIQYTAIQDPTDQVARYLSTAFDIDYADGLARPNTNLWVFDDQGRLILAGRDSNVSDDQPTVAGNSIDDLSRGSVGQRDAFIGAVELPAQGLAPGVYYVAVSNDAQIPAELQQYFSRTSTSTVRLEPVNSVTRVAEDHVETGNVTTAEEPQIPILFGTDDRVTLVAPAGTGLRDGESFTLTNAAGNSLTYEFDINGAVATGHVAIPYAFTDSATQIGDAIVETLTDNPPDSVDLTQTPLPTPTYGAPVVASILTVFNSGGRVTVREWVWENTLLNEVTRASAGQLVVTPVTRTTTRTTVPVVRQASAPGQARAALFVSRPAATPYDLSDVTLFVSSIPSPGQADVTRLLTIDPFSGEQITSTVNPLTGQTVPGVGTFGGALEDIAMHPSGYTAANNNGGLFGYAVPQTVAWDDDNSDNYWQVNPSTTAGNLGVVAGASGIETYEVDPADPTDAIRSNDPDGVGMLFNALTFSNAAMDAQAVHGFAVGYRGDGGAPGNTASSNVIFEIVPTTGAAINTPNTTDRTGVALYRDAGTQIRDRGTLDTTADAFSIGTRNTTINGRDATTATFFNQPQFDIEDGDYFQVDQDGDTLADVKFEFETGPEFWINVDRTTDPLNPQVLRDGDRFTVEGVDFEFDTGSVLFVSATSGSQLVDGGTFTITDGSTPPLVRTFEFDNNGSAGTNVPIPFAAASTRLAIVSSIVTAINSVTGFGVRASQLSPTSYRITLLGESATTGVTISAPGVSVSGAPGVMAGPIAIRVEENFTANQIGQAIMGVIDGTQRGRAVAGAYLNRLNFPGVQSVSFAGVTTPVFGTVDPSGNATGTAGKVDAQAVLIPFLASDNAAQIATRIQQTLVGAGFATTLSGSTVRLDPAVPQPTFLSTPPGVRGTPDTPLQRGGVGPGGDITGIAFVGPQLYAVTDTGGLFRISNAGGGAFNRNAETNVADYVDGSQQLLAAVNFVTSTTLDPLTGDLIDVTSTQPIVFSGLVTGPQDTEDGRYANLLFGITRSGRVFAFDTFGHPQPVFANGAYYVDTGVSNATGLAFSNLDENLWHVTNTRAAGTDHGYQATFDGSRPAELDNTAQPTGALNFYFGYDGVVASPTDPFAPSPLSQGSYDFPGGAHGTLTSNVFSLEGYSAGDLPTLYFNYFLETDQPTAGTDSFRVFLADDDGRWKLLATNADSTSRGTGTADDEYDPFYAIDPDTGARQASQPFQRAEAFDGTNRWRQARIDLSPYAGQDNLRLRIDFSTAGGMSTGQNNQFDLDTAGNELRAIPAVELSDGDLFTLNSLVTITQDTVPSTVRSLYAGFEFDLGPTLVVPTGAAIVDGDSFSVDGTVYEFDLGDGEVGSTNSLSHTPITVTGTETAEELAVAIQQVLTDAPPASVEILGDLSLLEPNDTLVSAFASGLNGTSQVFTATGVIGDDMQTPDASLDVDLVQLWLDAGDTVVIETNTRQLASQLDPYLRLFTASGNQVTANNNVEPNNPYNRDAQIVYTAAQRGVYYVGVSAAHNSTYDVEVTESGVAQGTTTSQGPYELTIAISDPNQVQRVGNRLNLPNAQAVTATGLPDSFVTGQGGLSRTSLTNPLAATDPSLPPIPVYAVRVHLGMDALQVADALRMALADQLAGGQVSAIKQHDETVQVVGYGIDDPGPLGISGPSDPFRPGLMGDSFSSFDQVEAIQNNGYEGAFLDDIIIGFAGRGEMVTGSAATANPQPVANPQHASTDIDVGAYQLEIRQATAYGQPLNVLPGPTLQLTDSYDINERLAEGLTLTVAGGEQFADGQTFTVSNGTTQVTFEFDDLTVADGTAATNMAIPFEPSDTPVAMARRLRDAVNDAAVREMLQVTAVSGDGVASGVDSTSTVVLLSGAVSATPGMGNAATAAPVVAPESNDTLAEAVVTGLVPGDRAGYQASGTIGDNAALASLGSDVDLYRIQLNAGELVAIDIDAANRGSSLDALLRVFDANGVPVTLLDPATGLRTPIESDDGAEPGQNTSTDPYLAFTAPAAGDYFIGVSGFDNGQYDATTLGFGSSSPAEFTPFNNALYFTAFTAATGRELWKLNAAGTYSLIADIDTAGSSDPQSLTVFNNALYFAATTSGSGRELWRIDASDTLTQVADIVAGADSSAPTELTECNSELYFTAFTAANGRELWKLDAAGTPVLVADIDPSGSADPADLTLFNNQLYFSAYTPTSGRELWRLTTSGSTAQVTEINPVGSSNPGALAVYNNELYFAAETPASGRELWKVNVLGQWRQMLPDLYVDGSSDPADLTVHNGTLFFAATTPTGGRELWKIDALGSKTLVADVNPGSGSSNPSGLTVFNSELYFAATANSGTRELWKITATEAATQVTRLEPAGAADPQDPTAFNNELYFSAHTAAVGRELFKVNGAGTSALVADLYQAARREGRTGFYQIDIERPHVSDGIEVETVDLRGDQNLEREQGQVVINGNRIRASQNAGVLVRSGARTTSGAPQPGPVRNLAQINSSRLTPGAAITNNILVGNAIAIDLSGDAGGAAAQPAVVPFARIVNNTIVSDLQGSGRTVTLPVVKLPGTVNGTSVYYADLSAVKAPLITSLTIHDNSFSLAGQSGMYSGLDLDAVKISAAALVTTAAQVPARLGLNVFDFTATGTALIPGTQLPPLDAALFGTLNGQVDGSVATLGSFDASYIAGGTSNSGFISLGLGGEITFNLTQPVSVSRPLYLYLGEVDDQNELTLATVTVTTATAPSGVGIRVRNASPTILNNLLSTLTTGIDADGTAQNTIVAGSLYQNNTQNTTASIGAGTYAVYAAPATQLFVDASNGNYYPAPAAPQIDSAVDSIEDRYEMVQVCSPLGIASSPILAPAYDADGQLRADDPAMPTPTGLGEDVFKDIGALDRADFAGPTVTLISPHDNGSEDLDPGLSLINLAKATLSEFAIQIVDGTTAQGGSGVDGSTITGACVHVTRNGEMLVQGVDYMFRYDATDHVIRLTPLAGVWDQNSNYVIELTSEAQLLIQAFSGEQIADGQSFEITDQDGSRTVFEYDSGVVLQVPETWALQIPQGGGSSPNGVADGDTITISDGIYSVTLELDSNGVWDTVANTRVQFATSNTQGEIADRLVTALASTGMGLSPVNVGKGVVHLGVNGTQTVTVQSATITQQGVALGVTDGTTLTVDNGTKLVTFEFNSDGRVATGNTGIAFSYAQTYEQIAATITTVLGGSNLGLTPKNLGEGRVQVGGGLNHQIDVSQTVLTSRGAFGVRLPWGFRLPTQAGAFTGLINDGDTFTISNGTGVAVTFEFNSDNQPTAPNTAVTFATKTTTDQLANTLVNVIRGAGLGLYPYNAGNGIVILGGNANYTLTPGTAALTQVGQPGLPAAVAIPYTPAATFTAADVAEATSDAINGQQLAGITAMAEGDQVVLVGAAQVVGALTSSSSGIRDRAGNALQANQTNGATRFTIYIGNPLDYGDAPAPYPTLLSEDGARHVIVRGFSLGATVNVNADGQPTAGATGDDDEDGVTFDAATPLIPGRTFNVTVTTSGIVDQVVSFGVLEAWIDWNGDGDWNDSGERVIANTILTPSALDGASAVTFTGLSVPSTAVAGQMYARFRLSTAGTALPTGEATAGEVEDYAITVLANPWQNPILHCDVNDNTEVSPIDVLLLINYINAHPGDLALPPVRPAGAPYLDPNGDGVVSAKDVLMVINYVNQLNAAAGNGEGEASAAAPSAASDMSPRGAALDSPFAGTTLVNIAPRAAAWVAGSETAASQLAAGLVPSATLGPTGSGRAAVAVTTGGEDSAEVDFANAASGAPTGSHLEDILRRDEDWSDMVADVGRAQLDANLQDAYFAKLGLL